MFHRYRHHLPTHVGRVCHGRHVVCQEIIRARDDEIDLPAQIQYEGNNGMLSFVLGA